ncbi:MAG: outer membrane protein transport protein [Acidobacteria bacterium]|nr:outer membrane protein transport protein [Acidobacteriota bacterium]
MLAFAAISTSCWPAAFTIMELGARATGMGGAFVAVASDGSALYYNPAGIAFQPGFRMEMDGLFVHGDFRFFPSATPPGTIVPKDGYSGFISPSLLVVPNMYMSKSISPKLTLGFGAFTPFGLGGNWTNFKDSDPAATKFVARWASTRPKMESIWMQPTVAYRVTRNLALAAGVAYVHTHALLEQSLLNPLDDGVVFGKQLAPSFFPGSDVTASGKILARLLPEARFRFAGVSRNVGANVGMLYWKPEWKTRFGFDYRTAVVQHFDGQASFAFTTGYALQPIVGLDKLAALFPNQKARVQFPTPATFAAGIATEVFGSNLISLDVQLQDYHRLKDVVLNFTQNKDVATPAEGRLVYNFHNATEVRLGFEHPMRKFTFRAGWAWDQTPVPDESVGPLWPDSTRLNFDVGVSRQMGNKELSFFYQGSKFLDRTTSVAANDKIFTNGLYSTFAQLFGFSLRIGKGSKGLEFTQ